MNQRPASAIRVAIAPQEVRAGGYPRGLSVANDTRAAAHCQSRRPRRRLADDSGRCSWLLALLILCCADPAIGQRRGVQRDTGPASPPPGALIEESAPVRNLLQRAADAAARKDWKLAIDSLQRIIDRPDPALIEVPAAGDHPGVGRYQTARRHAQQVLAQLPPEGLRAYRILTDGRAKALLQRAREAHDESALRNVVERYLLTTYGDDAADLLSSWLLDAGHPAAAGRVLDRVHALYPDSDVPRRRTDAKRAVASAMLGDASAAARIVAQSALPENDATGQQLRALVHRMIEQMVSGAAGRAASLEDWPLLGGDVTRRAVMPAMTPTLSADVPWQVALPGPHVGSWGPLHVELKEGRRLPVTHPVVADGTLFVKTLLGCLALDVESLETVWRADGRTPPVLAGSAWASRDRPARSAHDRARIQSRLLDDSIGNSLSTAYGLVLMVEWSRMPRAGDGFARQGRGGFFNTDATALSRSNRLAALDGATGRLRWVRGRSADPDDPLGAVTFLAAPIGVAGRLWVPCADRRDLFLFALDPSDGRPLGRVLLCSSPDAAFGGSAALFNALPPAAEDDTIYVPSGQGLFFAVDAATMSVRWAARYPHGHPLAQPPPHDRIRPGDPRFWLPTPPVVTGSLVLLAPSDHGELLAFDRHRGTLRWATARASHLYMVAADHASVWLAGEELARVSLDDGSTVWSQPLRNPVGRAVLSGPNLLVPTEHDVAMFDADTGRSAGTIDLPDGAAPLGNLLCLANALFSVDSASVRKYPDVERAFPDVLAAHRADPGDARAALRLASMQLARGEPQAAEEVLRAVRFGRDPIDRRRAEYADHLLVEVLIARAQEAAPPTAADDGSARRIALLREAVRRARRVDDVQRAHLLLADELQRADALAEAYDVLRSLAFSPEARGPVTIERHWRRDARSVIAERLAILGGKLDADEKQAIVSRDDRALLGAAAALDNPATRRAAMATLTAMAAAAPLQGRNQQALNLLGRWYLQERQYELSEQCFRAAERLDATAAGSAAAQMGLVELYASATLALRSEADRLLQRLERERPPASVPVYLPGQYRPRLIKVDQWLTTQRAALRAASSGLADGGGLAHGDTADGWSAGALDDRPAWPQPVSFDDGTSGTLLYADTRRPAALEERLLVYIRPNILRAYRLADGALDWETELLLPGDFDFERGPAGPAPPSTAHVVRRVAADGQTLSVLSRTALHGVGITTGRRLWARPLTGFTDADRPLLGGSVSAARGLVACTLRPGELSVLRTLDGSLVWARDTGPAPIADVSIRGPYVLTADPSIETVRVYQLRDGAQLATLEFARPSTDSVVPVCYIPGRVFGPDGDAVVAYETATGHRLWRHELEAPLVGLCQAAPDRLAVGSLGGDLRLLDAGSGRIVFRQQVDACRDELLDALLENGTLFLVGRHIDDRGTRRLQLCALNGTTGAATWTRTDLAYRNEALYDGRALRRADNVIPVLLDLDADLQRSPVRGESQRMAIALIDKRTGHTVDTADTPRGIGPLNGELDLWHDRLLVGARRGFSALTVTAAEPLEETVH